MKILIAGYGSIGSRHARILKELGAPVAVLSSREIEFKPNYRTLSEALRNEDPDYVVVANKTSEHFKFLKELDASGFKGIVLMEKPVFYEKPSHQFKNFKGIYVAYNLRFHPLLLRLKELLAGESVISVQCYVGKYLPQWRPETDYKNSYSARRNSGGGVLRDLSHELDYLNWMFGPYKRLTAAGGHLSDLEIDSDDIYCLMIEFEKCPIATVQMNYLDRVPKREIVVITNKSTFKADLIKGTLEINEKTEKFSVELDSTYRLEHQAVLNGNFRSLCSYEEGMEVLRMIEAAEKASHQKVWVS